MVKTAKEKPILFSTEMVKAILDGRKSQTRRVVKPQPPEKFKYPMQWSNGDVEFSDVPGDDDMANWWPGYERPVKCPYPPGTILWVRETWARLNKDYKPDDNGSIYIYKADHITGNDGPDIIKWRSPIHMPREAARLFLEVTNVRVERVNEISEDDARSEGVATVAEFKELWNKLNGKRGFPWSSRCWAWVISFERMR